MRYLPNLSTGVNRDITAVRNSQRITDAALYPYGIRPSSYCYCDDRGVYKCRYGGQDHPICPC